MAFQPVIRSLNASEGNLDNICKIHVYDTAIAHVCSYLDFFKMSCGGITGITIKKTMLKKSMLRAEHKEHTEHGGVFKQVKVTVVYDESKAEQQNVDQQYESSGLKSKKGRSPQQMKVNQKLHTHAKHWVERLHFLESKFMELRCMGVIAKSEFFPWNTNESFMYSKNSIKCVYLQLLLLYYGGIIQWCRSESSGSFFYGIESFVVPKEHRAVFDSCAVGSICSKEYKTPSTGDGGLSKKGLVKLWSTCGFIETLDKENGSLVYKYSAAERDKQRKHFANPCLA